MMYLLTSNNEFSVPAQSIFDPSDPYKTRIAFKVALENKESPSSPLPGPSNDSVNWISE